MKECRMCYEEKPLKAFSKNRQTYDKLMPICKECVAYYRKFIKEKRYQPAVMKTTAESEEKGFIVSFE